MGGVEREVKGKEGWERKREKKCGKREGEKGEERRSWVELVEGEINLIEGYMRRKMKIRESWWRLVWGVG